ncbi:MAG TPA: hypothetical protein PKL31_10355 [Fulvivirga sp.]|nr:hypothetical protein [Fulvivirga sp.]
MKYNIIILFIAAVAFSCNSVDDLLKTSANYSVEQTANVDLIQDGPKTFSITQEFATPADVDKFGSNLDAIEITGISMKFTNYTGTDVKITDASLDFVGTGSSISINGEIDLNAVNGAGAIDLDVTGIDFTAINAKFLTDKKISVKVAGTVNNVPVTFDVTFTIDIKVTGSI